MKLRDLYFQTLSSFRNNGIDFSENEARFLVCEYLSFNSSDFYLRYDEAVPEEIVSAVKAAASRRISGEPLQYIIGSWDFMGRSFSVGEGVLIPRPETELLCTEALDIIKNKEKPVVYDLCSGSGCIGLTIKCERLDAKVILLEKGDDAFCYLTQNANRLCDGENITLIKGDVLDFDSYKSLPDADIIISNPPYIKSREVPFLQKEVTFEPEMALDGGEDGLIFYRYIISSWSRKLKPVGVMLFEIGEDQGNEVNELFKKDGFDSIIIKDYNNHDRIAKGKKAL